MARCWIAEGFSLLEAVGVDAAEEVLAELKAVEGLDHLAPVRLDRAVAAVDGRGCHLGRELLGRGGVVRVVLVSSSGRPHAGGGGVGGSRLNHLVRGAVVVVTVAKSDKRFEMDGCNSELVQYRLF